ncbi:hypothetical protein ACTJLB_09085 [Paraburkholderia sp. 22098]|uniref:hypothetical protein n=1 Tax=Paraburkholderia sp. 22098 TaxID=3453874 RepID=UPI003F877E9C
MAADLILSIDDFDGVPSTLYVEVRLIGGNVTGTWKKTQDTLNGQPPFPGSGTYVTPMGGAMLSGDDGKPVCTLKGVVPGQPLAEDDDVEFAGAFAQVYTIARWHYPSIAP